MAPSVNAREGGIPYAKDAGMQMGLCGVYLRFVVVVGVCSHSVGFTLQALFGRLVEQPVGWSGQGLQRPNSMLAGGSALQLEGQWWLHMWADFPQPEMARIPYAATARICWCWIVCDGQIRATILLCMSVFRLARAPTALRVAAPAVCTHRMR